MRAHVLSDNLVQLVGLLGLLLPAVRHKDASTNCSEPRTFIALRAKANGTTSKESVFQDTVSWKRILGLDPGVIHRSKKKVL